MKVYKWGNDEVIVTEDTAVVPITMLKSLMLSYTNIVREYIGKGIYENENSARKWADDLDNVYYDICREHRELMEARKLQQEIPF